MTGEGPRRDLSLGRLALFSMGAAVVVLGVVTLLLGVLRPSPVVSLVIVVLGLIGAVAAMGLVSTRMVARATAAQSSGDPSRERPDAHDGNPGEPTD